MNTQTKNDFLPIEKDLFSNKYMTKDFVYKATLVIFSIILLLSFTYNAGFNAGVTETTQTIVSIYAGVQ